MTARAITITTTEPPAARGRPMLDPGIPIVLYAADEWGGVGGTLGYILMLSKELRRRGYRVAAICHPGDAVAPMRASLTEMGVEVHTVEGDVGGSPPARLWRHRALTSIIRAYRPCVLALMMGYFTRGGAVTLAGALAGAAGIIRADLTPPEPPITRRQGLALRLKDRLTDRVVVGAVENVDAFARCMGRSRSKMEVIHTGIELDRFRPGDARTAVRSALGYALEELIVGTVARLDDVRKGMVDFVEMASRIAPANPRARFLIVGDGVLRLELEARAERLGIRDRVTFAGYRTDVAALLDGIDVFVMPSLFEGGPTTVLEAMAMGKPTVATSVGMVPEVVEHGKTGLIVAPGDAGQLADAVISLLADESLRARLSASAREKALQSFSLERMADQYLQVFAQVVASRARRGW